MKDKKLNIPIWESKDYEKFKFYKGNREIFQPHIARIIKSFKEKYIYPSIIFVNENFEIIDGQHRFFACKKMDLPVQYIILNGAGFKEITLLNTSQKNWSSKDYLNFYCKKGDEHYIQLKEIIEEYKVTLAICGYLLRNQYNSYGFGAGLPLETFRTGCFELHKQERKDLIDAISKYTMIRNFWSNFSTKRDFCVAFRKILSNPSLCWKRLYDKIEKYHTTFEHRGNVQDYCREFTKIYNHKQRGNRIRLHDEVGYDN